MYVVNSKVMKAIDSSTINNIGIPSLVLMENAARSVVKCILEREQDNNKFLVIAGKGNNGGDGVCVARILHEMGYDVAIYLIGDVDSSSDETKQQIKIAKACGVSFVQQLQCDEYDIIIDAIFGIGLTRNIAGVYFDVIKAINDSSAKVYAVDVPSGINASTGEVLNIATNADVTVTFGVNKIGLIVFPGRSYAGEVVVTDIGFPNVVIEKECKNIDNKENMSDLNDGISDKTSIFRTYDKTDYRRFVPNRRENSNKGTYGKVLVIAGSKNMAGAAYLSAKAAYKMGAGLVKICTCEDNREIMQGLIPEAVLLTYTEDNYIDIIEKAIGESTCIVLGPGIGTSELASSIVYKTIEYNASIRPLILDADALNIVSNSDIENLNNVVMTPHIKELSRLIHTDVSSIKKKLYDPKSIYEQLKYMDLDNENNVLVMKDAVTMTINKRETYVNTSGNNGLATGGAGDVLTGIIAGLLAQGCNNITASSLGVYIHGLAAEEYVKNNNEYSLNASDIIMQLEKIL